MDKHITILGGLYIGISAMNILAAAIVFVAVAGGGVLSGDQDAMMITTIVATAIALFLVLLAAPGIVAGIGLLRREYYPLCLHS